jgi:hypothetical protein
LVGPHRNAVFEALKRMLIRFASNGVLWISDPTMEERCRPQVATPLEITIGEILDRDSSGPGSRADRSITKVTSTKEEAVPKDP